MNPDQKRNSLSYKLHNKLTIEVQTTSNKKYKTLYNATLQCSWA